MNAIYNLSGLLMSITVIAGIIGLVKPSLFRRFLGKRTNRKTILLFVVIGFFVFGSLLAITEPASVKEARTARETASRLEKERAEQAAKEKEAKANRQQLAKTEEQSESQTSTSEPKADPRYYWHQVLDVIDGDTIKVRVDGKEETIRVIGIDAPESANECYGVEASAKSREFLISKWIQLESDSSQDDRDVYGRLLRIIWFDNGTDFGKRMLEEGHVYEYTFKVAYKSQSQYKDMEQKAKDGKLGLWSAETCEGHRQKPQPVVSTPQAAIPAPQPQVAPTPAPTPDSSAYYANCKAARAAGAAPLYAGQPGYRSGLDGDSDGVACEN